ncbi:MAG: HAD family hydrolase [Candidatus Riflebacteria bacterium]|nr:HAD family hydrolase [Candidatus Riflebacteria bacterium]
MLVILDLDETLIHSSEAPLDRIPDFRLGEYHTYKRPGIDAFLRTLADADDVELAVWSSSTEDYVQEVVRRLFGGLPLAFAWSRRRCTRLQEASHGAQSWHSMVWSKKLQKVRRRGFDLDYAVMVDDSPRSIPEYGNVIAVTPWTGEPGDTELTLLLPFLLWLRGRNVRRLEKREWRKRSWQSSSAEASQAPHTLQSTS